MTTKPFKLQSVLDYRTLLRNIAQQELYKSREAEAGLANALLQAQEELARLHQDLESRQHTGISVQELILYENHCDHKMQAIDRLEQELQQIREKITQQRLALTRANSHKKLLEKLKRKQLAIHEQKLRKKETSEADETAVCNHNR